MAVQLKGGFPVTRRVTVSDAPASAAAAKRIAPARTIRLRITNTDAVNALEVYWTEEDLADALATTSENYVTIPPLGVWSEPAEIVAWWPLALAAPITVEVTYFARRA